MAGTGPTPNPNSRRQTGNQAHTWLDLPAEGYDGTVPDWPLSEPSVAEDAMWSRYWRKPQAAAWARIGLVDEVALYVRLFLVGSGIEAPDVKAATEARQIGDRLGLNPAAMLKNRWRVRADEVGQARETKAQETGAEKARRRLKVADGAVAGS
jgi:hypothetical protein